MLHYFQAAPLWLKIIMVIIALPPACFLSGIGVCLFDPSSISTENDASLKGILRLGAITNATLAVLFGGPSALNWLFQYFFGDENFILAVFISIILAIGCLAFVGSRLGLN